MDVKHGTFIHRGLCRDTALSGHTPVRTATRAGTASRALLLMIVMTAGAQARSAEVSLSTPTLRQDAAAAASLPALLKDEPPAQVTPPATGTPDATPSGDKDAPAPEATLPLSSPQTQSDIRAMTESQAWQTALKTQAAATCVAESASQKAADSQVLAGVQQSLSQALTKNADLSRQLADVMAGKTTAEMAYTAEKSETGKTIDGLKQSVTQGQSRADALKAQLDAQMKKQADTDAALAAAQKSLLDSQAQTTTLTTQLADATAKLTTQAGSPGGTQTAAGGVAAPQTPEQLKAYALGTLWGQDVSTAVGRMNAGGITLDLSQVASGVSDAINNQFKVPREKIVSELEALNRAAGAAQGTQAAPAMNPELEAFSKLRGAKRADEGYYYRVIKKGKGRIRDTDTVTIQVSERLADGTVVKDMAKSGNILTLPVAKFPPLFASALLKMQNKGNLKMMVPPELAYGDKGLPPDIPPSATMLYDITVLDVRAK